MTIYSTDILLINHAAFTGAPARPQLTADSTLLTKKLATNSLTIFLVSPIV